MARARLRDRLLAGLVPDDERLARRKRRRPWGTWQTTYRSAACYLGIVCWLAVGVLLGDLVTADSPAYLIDPGTLVIAVFSLTAVAFVGLACSWLASRKAAVIGMVIGGTAAFVAALGGTLAITDLILDVRGQPTTAVIASAQQHTTGRGAVYYEYALRHLDGRPVHGQLMLGDTTPRPAGTQLDVIEDPVGFAAPELTGQIATATDVTVAASGLGVLAATTGLVAAHGERQRRQWHRPGSRHGVNRRSPR